MRLLLILVATGCIAWLLNTLVTLNAPREVDAYLCFLGMAGVLAYFVFERIPQHDRTYAICYGAAMLPICLTAGIAAARWTIHLGLERGFGAFITAIIVGTYFTWLFLTEIPKPHGLATYEMLTVGFCFLAAGILTLTSAVVECSALQFRLRVGLGLFWLTSGVYAFCDALGVHRSAALWRSASQYVTQINCILFLGGLAWLLSGMQPESSRQQIRGQHVEHAALYEGES
jgi:hypothetical protein